MKKIVSILLILLIAGCTDNSTGMIVADSITENTTEFETDIFSFENSMICESFDGEALVGCGNNFELSNSLFYYTNWSNAESLTLNLYHNNTLYDIMEINESITELSFPGYAGGNWKLVASNSSGVVDELEFTFSFGVPEYLADFTTRTFNNDADLLRDGVEIIDLKVYNTLGYSIPITGVLEATIYGIKLNLSTGGVETISFIDNWEREFINSLDESILFEFSDNETNVFEFDYGQLFLTLVTENGNFSNFNPEISFAQ